MKHSLYDKYLLITLGFFSGVVRFETNYVETFEGSDTASAFVVVPQEYFFDQRMIYRGLSLDDGKRFVFHIRGYDVMDVFAEDNAIVWIDQSAPVIENLWLTRGDFLNISVHNVTELEDLTYVLRTSMPSSRFSNTLGVVYSLNMQ